METVRVAGERFADDVRQLLAWVRSRPEDNRADLYAVSVRYPPSTVATAARSVAARRALDYGNPSGTRALAAPG